MQSTNQRIISGSSSSIESLYVFIAAKVLLCKDLSSGLDFSFVGFFCGFRWGECPDTVYPGSIPFILHISGTRISPFRWIWIRWICRFPSSSFPLRCYATQTFSVVLAHLAHLIRSRLEDDTLTATLERLDLVLSFLCHYSVLLPTTKLSSRQEPRDPRW